MTVATGFVLHPQLAADSACVASLALCELRLMDDSHYPWLILVPRIADARELVDLDEVQQIALLREISDCSRVLQRLFSPDKLNVAALGNMVPQLHVHVIARTTRDAAWPAPVWGRVPALHYADDARERLLATLREALGIA